MMCYFKLFEQCTRQDHRRDTDRHSCPAHLGRRTDMLLGAGRPVGPRTDHRGQDAARLEGRGQHGGRIHIILATHPHTSGIQSSIPGRHSPISGLPSSASGLDNVVIVAFQIPHLSVHILARLVGAADTVTVIDLIDVRLIHCRQTCYVEIYLECLGPILSV